MSTDVKIGRYGKLGLAVFPGGLDEARTFGKEKE
jgi:hypothetical protein